MHDETQKKLTIHHQLMFTPSLQQQVWQAGCVTGGNNEQVIRYWQGQSSSHERTTVVTFCGIPLMPGSTGNVTQKDSMSTTAVGTVMEQIDSNS